MYTLDAKININHCHHLGILSGLRGRKPDNLLLICTTTCAKGEPEVVGHGSYNSVVFTSYSSLISQELPLTCHL